MHSYRPRAAEPCPYECRPSCTLFPRTPEGRIVLPLPAPRQARRHPSPITLSSNRVGPLRVKPHRFSRETPIPVGDPMQAVSTPSYLNESAADRSNPLYASHSTSITSTTLFPTSGSAESQLETLVSPNIPHPRVVNLIPLSGVQPKSKDSDQDLGYRIFRLEPTRTKPTNSSRVGRESERQQATKSQAGEHSQDNGMRLLHCKEKHPVYRRFVRTAGDSTDPSVLPILSYVYPGKR